MVATHVMKSTRLRVLLASVAVASGVAVAGPGAVRTIETLPEPIVIEGGRAQIERSFDALCRAHAASVLRVEVELEDRRTRTSHAVAVEAAHVLAKMSELGDSPFLVFDSEGERYEGAIVATDVATDLALVRLEGAQLEPIDLVETDATLRVGQWIGAAGPGGTCMAVGSVSVGPRTVRVSRDDENRGLLGVYLDERYSERARIRQLVDGGAAGSAGIRTGDVIVAVDRRVVASREDAQDLLGRSRPDQQLLLTIERDGVRLDRTVRMGAFSRSRWRRGRFEAHTADAVDVSLRRDGFDGVVQHDAHLEPSECLSPAVDVHGRVVGLHVARMDRPGSLALPASQVRLALERLWRGVERARGEQPTGADADEPPIDERREV